MYREAMQNGAHADKETNMNNEITFTFDGRTFELKQEEIKTLSGEMVPVWTAYRDGKKADGIQRHRNIINVKRQIVENYETMANAVKRDGREIVWGEDGNPIYTPTGA
jgi:hypothetical protein